MEDKPQQATGNSTESWGQTAWAHFESVQRSSPLVQCITNFVSMDLVANVLLSAGASPAMVHSVEEIPDFTPKTHAVYINVGTLTPEWLPAMKMAARAANDCRKPWVLDPVSAGASGFRLASCLELLKLRPAVVRGNGSEIMALFRGTVDGNSKGVDSTHESTDTVEAAKSLARTTRTVVAVSGAIDIVTDGHRVVAAKNGVHMLQKVTATGCAVTGLIAAFVAANPSRPLEAAASALAVFGLAAEVRMGSASGPGSLRVCLVDALYGLDRGTVEARVSIENIC